MSIDKIKPEDYSFATASQRIDEIIDKADNALNEQVGGEHYKKYAIQPAEYCQRNKLNSLESSIIRYATRHQDKNGREDIEKIIHCAKLILKFDYAD
jgi:low affinity Fe/Cu permease